MQTQRTLENGYIQDYRKMSQKTRKTAYKAMSNDVTVLLLVTIIIKTSTQ